MADTEINKPLSAAQDGSRRSMVRASWVLIGLAAIVGVIYGWGGLVAAVSAVLSWLVRALHTITQPLFGEKMLVVAGGTTAVLCAAFARVAVNIRRVPDIAGSSTFKAILYAAALGSVVTYVQTFAVTTSLLERWDAVGIALFLMVFGCIGTFGMLYWGCLERTIPARTIRVFITLPNSTGVLIALVNCIMLDNAKLSVGYMLVVMLLSLVNAVMMAGINAAQDLHYVYLRETKSRVENVKKWLHEPFYVNHGTVKAVGGDLVLHARATPVDYDDAKLQFTLRMNGSNEERLVVYDDFVRHFCKGVPKQAEEAADTGAAA